MRDIEGVLEKLVKTTEFNCEMIEADINRSVDTIASEQKKLDDLRAALVEERLLNKWLVREVEALKDQDE